MAQDTQMIGQVSADLERVAAEKPGWQGTPAEQPIDEITDASDFSRYDRRTNAIALGRQIDNIAGYQQTPAAAVEPTPTPSLTPATPVDN